MKTLKWLGRLLVKILIVEIVLIVLGVPMLIDKLLRGDTDENLT